VKLPEVIPIFPLPDTVLFPGMPLPLHVFEPRYRKMTADALAAHGMLGMVLLQPGHERDYYGRPPVFAVGCAGVIEQHRRLDDGRYNLLLRGRVRFRVLREEPGEPYRLAHVEALAEAGRDEQSLSRERPRILAAVARATDGPSLLVMQKDLPADLFVNAVCQTIGLKPVERQALLESETVPQRARRLVQLLEFQALERSLGRREVPTVH
jgi:Lon protease-like protein